MCICVCAVAHSFNQFILHNVSVVLVNVALLPILEGEKKQKNQHDILR